MKRIAVLGSTGSIGQNALDVIRSLGNGFRVAALSSNTNADLLYRQIKAFQPESVCIKDISASRNLKSRLNAKMKLFCGDDGLVEMLQKVKPDKVLLAISGAAALRPLLEIIDSGIDVALANKESMVMAGPIIMKKARAKNVKIIPVDSELSAIWQCLENQEKERLKNIYLTASGGPLRKGAMRGFKNVSLRQVMRHPRWKMGSKITVDSATLMNKGLEVLETMFLFDIELEKIKVVIHPEAIIHSMVEFIDGVILAQLSATDMRIPIQYALSYPSRMPSRVDGLDFYKLRKFNFERPDLKRFPCLALAYRAAQEKGTFPCVLNAANEVCVEEFLGRRLDFVSIAKVVRIVLDKHKKVTYPDLEDIQEADAWARREAHGALAKFN
jgi:1-deoxy-D-xylulose-5-phosphate reductoisomerase